MCLIFVRVRFIVVRSIVRVPVQRVRVILKVRLLGCVRHACSRRNWRRLTVVVVRRTVLIR